MGTSSVVLVASGPAFADGPPSCGVPVGGGQTTTVTCNETGSLQSFTYPAGVHSATFTVKGAKGGAGGGPGGFGGETVATISDPPGTVLDVEVGGQASGTDGTAGGYGGGGNGSAGGGGGGGSYVSTFGGIANPDDLLLAAGGGGGTGQTANSNQNSFGGAGGGTTGGDGNSVPPAVGGTGGTQTEGGTTAGHPADDGGFEQGGNGCSEGGGGGGGFYGGGGGDNGATNSLDCGGGGGGSGYVSTSSVIDQGTATQTPGVSEYAGVVTIVYEPPTPTTVSFTFSPSPAHVGQAVTVTATVRPVPPGGVVTFGYDKVYSYGPAVKVTTTATATKSKPAGTASIRLPKSLAVGTHQAGGYFSGAGDIEGAGGMATFKVLPALATEHLTEKVTSRHKGKLEIKVATKPKLAGAKVTVYVVAGGHRHKIGKLKTAASGKQSGTISEKAGKTVKIQVGVGATKTTSAALSTVKSIKVKN